MYVRIYVSTSVYVAIDTQGKGIGNMVYLIRTSPALCTTATYDTIAWLKFLNTLSTLRNGNVWSWTFEFD